MNDHLRIGACLSLSGKFALFGRQAARGLQAWRCLDGTADILLEDDHSDRRTLEAVLPDMAASCDILLGGMGRESLWGAAADLETSTLFGSFGIDPGTGAQIRHRTVLVRWTDGEPRPVGTSEPATA